MGAQALLPHRASSTLPSQVTLRDGPEAGQGGSEVALRREREA